MLAEYRSVVDESDVLKGYNDHVQHLVNDQKSNIASLERQIGGIDKIKQRNVSEIVVCEARSDLRKQFFQAPHVFGQRFKLAQVLIQFP